MPVTQERPSTAVPRTARQILEEGGRPTIASSAPAFDAQAVGRGRVPTLYLSTLGGYRRVTDIETINENTYRVWTRTGGLMLGELFSQILCGGHPLLREADVR